MKLICSRITAEGLESNVRSATRRHWSAFSNDDMDGNENVAVKMNSRFFELRRDKSL